MPKSKKAEVLTPETKKLLVKEGRAHALLLANVLKSLEYYPKAVDRMMDPILKVLKNIETATEREKRKEAKP